MRSAWSSWQLHNHAVSAHLRASTESQKSEHCHCWRQTLPLRGVLFHPASEKEIVRDVTEKRLHRVFIATQSPNRLHELPDGTCSLLAPNAPVAQSIVPSSLVMSQRNVCCIVFSSRHRAHVADLSFPCMTKKRPRKHWIQDDTWLLKQTQKQRGLMLESRRVSCAGVAPRSCPTNGNLVIVPSALEAVALRILE